MPLQSSGQISFANINTELGRDSTQEIGLNQAEAGIYGAINTNSSVRPDGSTPNAINEWWGYNHTIPALTVYTGCGRSNTNSGVCEDANNNRIFYSNCGPFDLAGGCTIYVDTFANPLIGYEYVYIAGSTYTINNSTGALTGFADYQC
jgi:hypothetical protein